jgi:hypothetical protein
MASYMIALTVSCLLSKDKLPNASAQSVKLACAFIIQSLTSETVSDHNEGKKTFPEM